MERHDYVFDLSTSGGGHGNANILWGASEFFPRKRTNAIVTQSDDGGDSGKLIEAYNVDPPGDKRMCAMPLASDETQPENNQLHQYRFTRKGSISDYSIWDLTMEILAQNHETETKAAIAFRRLFGIPLSQFDNGHEIPKELKRLMEFKFPKSELDLEKRCYGNLVIAACELIYGDAQEGFEIYRKLFNIQGTIVPVTTRKSPTLHGEFDNGIQKLVIKGESNIGSRDKDPLFDSRMRLRRVYHDGELYDRAGYLLKNSCIRVWVPGSPDTSAAPVLGTKGYAEVLEEANHLGGRTVIIPPIMNSEGTLFRDATEVIEFYLCHLNGRRELITDVILSETGIPEHGERRYAEYGQTKIQQNERGCKILLPHARVHMVRDLIEYDMSTGRIGHNPHTVGKALYDIWMEAA